MIHKVTQWAYHKTWGMLVVRLASGYVFLVHGWAKLSNLGGARGFFAGLGLPAETATFIAIIEVVGGLMLILGIAPRLAGLVLALEMAVAIVLVALPRGSYELELLLLAAALTTFLVGGGKYSLYSMEKE